MAGVWAQAPTSAKVVAGVCGVAVVVGAAGIAVAQSGGPDDRDRATVVSVIDGDTIDAEIGGDVERVRLLNIDTPETKHPEKAVQCLGPEATDFLEGLLAPGDRIELVYDVERTDRYDRTLAGVYKGEDLVNAAIAEAGLGVAVLFEPNDRFYQEVLDAQSRAEEAGRGLHDPQVDCTLPALAEALPPLEELPAQIPTDAADVASALAAVAPLIAAGQVFEGALGLAESGKHAVLSAAYGTSTGAWRTRVDEALPAAVAYQGKLEAAKAELEEAERRAEAERKAAEKKERERKAAEKAAAEKAVAEEAERRRAAERAAAEQRAAEQAAAERRAAEERAREAQREAERNRRQPPAPAPAPRQPSSGGYGTDADFPGYTGPRCYAPGGQVWKPC